jgi:GT2 family glycosyltransferase
MLVHLLVLNYNGRRLLGRCLPSVLEAAWASSHRCRVTVIDNDSRDDSVAWLAREFAEVEVIRRPNRGLCSFNDVVPRLEGPVALLLNNDIGLDRHAVDPLVEALLAARPGEPPWFMAAPKCWLPDGTTYEGFRTAVRWRWGLVQATARFAGHEAWIDRPGLTASAGAAMAVDRDVFAMLGGFDPLYLPGRLEDLDFAFRAYLAGYRARYVPESVAYHLGMATFGSVFGQEGCDRLALRNTLLFQWKNLRDPLHRARQWTGLFTRLVFDLLRAPRTRAARRWPLVRAWLAARSRWRAMGPSPWPAPDNPSGERDFFRRFHPRQLQSESAWAPATEAVSSLPLVEAEACR